jgi:hypothetical protein
MSSTDRRAERLEDLAAEIGLAARSRRASTGTVYVTAEHPRTDARITVRVSDHADAYATADYSADGVEGTDAGARAALLALRGTTPRALRRLRAWRRGRAARKASSAREAWIAGWIAQTGCSRSEAERECPVR